MAAWLQALWEITSDPLVILFALLSLAYGLDRLFNAGGRLLPIMILAVAPPIGWLTGYVLPSEIRSIGLIMFIYVIGLEAGSTFFPTFRRHWRRFITIGVIASALAGVVAWLIGHAYGWPRMYTAAFYSGAVTSTPAFDGLAPLGTGAHGANPDLFDLTYFIGVIWAVIAVLIVRWLWVQRSEHSRPYPFSEEESSYLAPYYVSVHRVSNSALIGKPMEQTILRGMPQAQAIRYQRDTYIYPVTDAEICHENDLIVLVGASPRLSDMGSVFIGPTMRVTPDDPLVENLPVRFETVTVNAAEFIDTVVDLEDLGDTYGLAVRGWWRGREYYPATHTARWRQGDRLRVFGTGDRVRQFREVMEKSERGLNEEIDLLRFSVGAVVAVFIGGLALPVGPHIKLSLGVTGGALFAGLIFGRSARIQIPRGAAFFLKELGLGLFLAGVGMSVGKQGLAPVADLILVPGVLAVVTIPVALAAWFLRRVKMPGSYVAGGVCGALTSTPALIVATRMDETSEPATTYAGIYLFALLTSVGIAQVIALFG